MRINYYFIIIGMFSFLFSSCGSKNVKYGITHFAYQETKNGNWGIMSLEGEIVIPPTFQNMPTPVTDDMFFVPTQDETYELYNIKSPQTAIGRGYIKISSFSEGKAFVVQEGANISCIDKKGNILYKLSDEITIALPFCYERALIGKIDEDIASPVYGFIDKNGKTIIPCDLLAATSFSGRYAVVGKKNAEHICVIDKNGTIIDNINNDADNETFNAIADNLSVWGRIETGIIPYVANGNFGLKKIKGDIVLMANSKYKTISHSNNGYCVFQTKGGYGIMKETGEEIVADKYSFIGACNENGSGCFTAGINNKEGGFDKWGIYSMDEKPLCEAVYDLIWGLADSKHFIALKNGEYLLITKKGKILKHFYNVNFVTAFISVH